jgi:hypothetical protein
MSSITSTTEVNELLEGFDAALKDLGTMRKQFAKMLGSKKRRSGPKDPDAEPGESRSAWQEWAKTCAGRFAKDYAAHLEEVGKKADVMTFASKCRAKTRIEEWTAHEAEWLEAHPKPEATKKAPKKNAAKGGAKAAIVGSEDEAVMEAKPAKKAAKKPAKKAEEASSADEGSAKKPAKKAAKKAEEGSGDEASSKKPTASADEGASTSSKKSKKKAPVADEALPEASPAPEAKKRLTKAEKEAAAAAALAASEAAAKANPPTPCKYRGKDYLKNDLNQVWQVGEDGAVGAWHGILSEDGKKMEKSDGPI